MNTVKQDAELATIWADIARGRFIEAKYTRDQIEAAVLREGAANAQRTSEALRTEALERLFWRTDRGIPAGPTEAEKRALGLDDMMWPEQLKAAHRAHEAGR